jgi:protein-disulfide isomerase
VTVDGGLLSGVRATPTFFVNGKLQDVSYGLQALAQGIEAALNSRV